MSMHRSVLFDPPEVEYIDGHPFPKVSPKRTHALVQKALLRILDDCAGERGDVGPEWRFNLGVVDETYTELVPDIAFVAFERTRELDNERAEEPPFAPDIAVEIRSPSSSPALIERKIEKYLACGALLALDVDPRSSQSMPMQGTASEHLPPGDRFDHPAAPWFTFDVAAIFPKQKESRG